MAYTTEDLAHLAKFGTLPEHVIRREREARLERELNEQIDFHNWMSNGHSMSVLPEAAVSPVRDEPAGEPVPDARDAENRKLNSDDIPAELERFKREGESVQDFRGRAFQLLFRLGMDEGEHFADAPPLTKQERIDLVPMLVANFKAGNWLNLDDSIRDVRVPMSPNDEDALKGPE